jgi:L-amino acid N-acyltransferase
MDRPTIRDATGKDLAAINTIYNYYVENSTCTYQTEPDTLEERAEWFAAHGAKHPVIVAEWDGEVVGWGSLSPFRGRCAYRFTVENSIYIRGDMHRRGIGRALLTELMERAAALGHHTIIAAISAEQAPSVALHERAGFVKVAHLREVGFKAEQWLDVVYMQLML